MANPLLDMIAAIRNQGAPAPSSIIEPTPFMAESMAEFRRQLKPRTTDPGGKKSIANVLGGEGFFAGAEKPEAPGLQRGFLKPGSNFARGVINRGKDPIVDLGLDTPDTSPIQIPNLEQGIGGKLAEGAGEFLPELAAGAAIPLAAGAKALTQGTLTGAETALQDIVAGRSAKEVALGGAAGFVGGAVAGRLGGKTASAAAKKGLLGEAFDEVVFKEAIEKGVLPFAKEDIVAMAARIQQKAKVDKEIQNSKEMLEFLIEKGYRQPDQHVADVAAEVLKQPDLPFGKIVQEVNHSKDVIEQAGRLGKTVREVVTETGVQKALPPGDVKNAVALLPEWAERRTVGRITQGVRRSQRLLQAGDIDMGLYRTVIGMGDVKVFRTAVSALGLPADEVNAIVAGVTKEMTKARKGRIASAETRGEFFLKKFDELTQAPDVPDLPGGQASRLSKPGGTDAVEASRSVREGFETPDKVVAAEAQAEVRAGRIADMAEKLGEKKVTVARLRKAITSEKPFRSLPGSTQFAADSDMRTVLRNAGLRDKKRQDRILNALSREERRDQAGVLKVMLRDGLKQAGLSATQVTEKMGRMSEDQIASMAVQIRAGKEKLTGQIATAMREVDPSVPHIKALQKAREAMEQVADSRTPLSDESGFLQIGRILEGAQGDSKEIIKNAVEIINKKTPKGKRTRKIIGSLILNQYLFRLAGRMRDVGTSVAALAGQRLGKIPSKGGLAQFKGLLDRSSPATIRTAFTTAADTWRTGIIKEIREAVASGQMLEGDIPAELLRANIDLSEFGTGLVGFAKRFPFLPTRFNSAFDDFMTTLSYTMERNYLAARKASSEGLTGAQAERRMWQIVGQTDETMDAQAWETARRVVFREKNPNAIAKFVTDIGKAAQNAGGNPVLQPIMRYFALPFLRTPAIIASRTLEVNPVVQMAKAIGSLVDGNLGKAAQHTGASVVGSAGLYSAYSLAEENNITGAGDHLGPAERDAAQRAGTWAPNSVRIGDRWVSYVGWGPVAAGLSMAANLYERNQKGDFKSPHDVVIGFGQESVRGAINATFMPAYARIIDGIAQPSRYGSSFGEQIAGIFGGIGSIAQIAESMDPERKFATGGEQGIQAIIPGGRGDLPAKAGTFGEASERPDSFFSNLFFPRQTMISEDPLIVHMFSLDALPGRPNVPNAPAKATEQQRRAFKFSPEEMNEVRHIKGKLERESLELFMKNRGGVAAYADSGRSPKLMKKQMDAVRQKTNGKVNKIIINLRLAGQKINERVIRQGLGE